MNNETELPKFGYSSPLRIPPELDYLIEKITESRELLEPPPSFYDEGDEPPTEATLVRANDFLLKNAVTIFEQDGITIPAPNINCGPDASIDMYWKNNSQELLINIPSGQVGPVTFYGLENNQERINGDMSLDAQKPDLFNWLK